MKPKYWSAKQLMKRYRISKATLWRAFQEGAPRKPNTRRIWVQPTVFEAWVETNRPDWLLTEFRRERSARSEARRKAWETRKAAC